MKPLRIAFESCLRAILTLTISLVLLTVFWGSWIWLAEARLVLIAEDPVTDLPNRNALSLLRWNSAVEWTPTPADYENIFQGENTLRYLQFYRANWSTGYPEIFTRSPLFYFYSYYTYWPTGATFPDLTDSNIRYMVYNYSANNIANMPKVFPTNWNQATYFQRFYCQYCNLSAADQVSLINSMEARINQGLGTGISGAHYMFFHGTGTNANAIVDPGPFLLDGWTLSVVGSYSELQKTINGQDWRVRIND